MSKNDTQAEILEGLIFGGSYHRIMAMSQEKHDALMAKMNAEAKTGFQNSTVFEVRYFMWWQLSLMTGFSYQPAETQGESDIESEVYRDFWTALKHYTDMKGDGS